MLRVIAVVEFLVVRIVHVALVIVATVFFLLVTVK